MEIKTKKKLIHLFLAICITIYFFIILNYLVYIDGSYINERFLKNITVFSFVLVFLILFVGYEILSNINRTNNHKIIFRFLSENYFQIITFTMMFFFFLIPFNSYYDTITDWNIISPVSLIKGIVYLIGCSFIPGACIYNLLLKKTALDEKFKTSPSIVKLTIFPLLSYIFIGTSVLILDQIGFERSAIETILFLLIAALFFINLLFQMRRYNLLFYKKSIEISKSEIFILLIGLIVLLNALIIHLSVEYLIAGDSWVGIQPAIHIGDPYANTIDKSFEMSYPTFWAYPLYGISVLSGIPLINLNSLMAPFCYLFILSIYLFVKSILHRKREIYSILTTFFISTFSSLYIGISLGMSLVGDLSWFVFYTEFYFSYKNFGFTLLFFSLAILLTHFRNKSHNTTSIIIYMKQYKNIPFLLGVFLLFLTFMTYTIAFFAGIYILFLYFLIFQEKREGFQLFIYLMSLIAFFFIIFDFLMNFFLSYLFIYLIDKFFYISSFLPLNNPILAPILIYSLILIFCMILYVLNKKLLENKRFSLKCNFQYSSFKKIFLIFVLLLYFFFISEIVNIILENTHFISIQLQNSSFLFYYVDKLITKFGIIGTLGLFLSYIYYENLEKRLLFFLLLWIFISLGIASLLFLKTFLIDFPFSSPINIPSETFIQMNYWFRLNWSYAIVPLSILCSFGIVKLSKWVQFNVKINNYKIRQSIKYFSISLLLVSSCSNFIINTFFWHSGQLRIEDEEAQVIGWMSENIPKESTILSEKPVNSHFSRGLGSMTNCHIHYFYNVFPSSLFSDGIDFDNLDEIFDFIFDKKINYFVHNLDFDIVLSNGTRFIEDWLIPNFYNVFLYEYGGLTVYYASF